MTDASIYIDRRSLPDRRFVKDRRTFAVSSLFFENRKVEPIRHTTRASLLFDFLCLMVIAALSLGLGIATGYYNGVISSVAHVTLGGSM
jgi:hypothetical protein